MTTTTMTTTFGELHAAIMSILPNASFGEDNDGQIIVYTNMQEIGDGRISDIDDNNSN